MTAPVEPEVDGRFVTLADLLDYLRVPAGAPGTDQVKLSETLNATLEHVAYLVGPLEHVARDVVVWPSGCSLVLPDTHLTEVQSVTNPDGTLIDVPARGLNLLAGVIEFPRGLIRGPWTVRYTGREHAASVRLAVKIIASHLWETQRGRDAGAGARSGIAVPVGDDSPVRMGFAIPSRAAELLKPFLRPRGLG